MDGCDRAAGGRPAGEPGGRVDGAFRPAGEVPEIGQVQRLTRTCKAVTRPRPIRTPCHGRLAGWLAAGRRRRPVRGDLHLPAAGRATRSHFERSRTAFLTNLLYAASAPGGPGRGRPDDAVGLPGACAGFPRLNDALAAHLEQVGPMRREELREAIERPAYLVGCEVEAALTERLLADVAGQRGPSRSFSSP